MSTLRRKAAALALGSSIAGAILAAFAWWRAEQRPQLDPDVLHQWQVVQAELPAAHELRQRLLAEPIEAGAEAWAGEYLDSNGYESRRLVLTPREFFYEFSHCTGTGELARGKVQSVDGALVRLAPTFHVRPDTPRDLGPDARSEFWFEPELYVVPWNAKRLIVPASKMPEFCRLAKAGSWSSMRYADYPRLRTGEDHRRSWDVSFEGLPQVPEEFRHLVPAE